MKKTVVFMVIALMLSAAAMAIEPTGHDDIEGTYDDYPAVVLTPTGSYPAEDAGDDIPDTPPPSPVYQGSGSKCGYIYSSCSIESKKKEAANIQNSRPKIIEIFGWQCFSEWNVCFKIIS